MRRLFTTSLAMAALFCFLNQAFAAAPRLEIGETSFDFKEAYEGERISHDYLIRNSGTAVLEIKEVRRT